jgi:hypothetical protein
MRVQEMIDEWNKRSAAAARSHIARTEIRHHRLSQFLRKN